MTAPFNTMQAIGQIPSEQYSQDYDCTLICCGSLDLTLTDGIWFNIQCLCSVPAVTLIEMTCDMILQMSNQARWAVLQAFSLLKEHRKVHEAVVQGLEQGASLATLINTIETSMAAQA